MKKLSTLVLFVSTLLVACTSSEESLVDAGASESKMKASELFVYSGGQQLGQSTRGWNKNEENGYSIPVDGKYDVWYFIRIDGNIPGEPETNLPANQYFPQTTAGKTRVADLNHGTVLANAAWRENTVKDFPKYIFSTDGSAVQSIIVDEPTLDDLLAANQSTKYDLSGYAEHKDELHFIWYACKQQGSDHIWHVDGILTTKEKTDISETDYGPDQIKNYEDAGMVNDHGSVVTGVEVDIHQQAHKDWNEIKTSIHLRDNVTAEVFIPLDYAEQADDFAIRAGVDYEYITEVLNSKVKIGETEYNLDVSITHEEGGIRIIVKPNAEALAAAKELYNDGITYELHNYVTYGIPQENIWAKLKNSTVTVSPYTKVYGQITSAYYEDVVPITNTTE